MFLLVVCRSLTGGPCSFQDLVVVFNLVVSSDLVAVLKFS